MIDMHTNEVTVIDVHNNEDICILTYFHYSNFSFFCIILKKNYVWDYPSIPPHDKGKFHWRSQSKTSLWSVPVA